MHASPTREALAHRFQYHAPHGDQAKRYEQVRAAIQDAAIRIVDLTPCSPEQTRALNALDEAMFLANAAIARHDDPYDRPYVNASATDATTPPTLAQDAPVPAMPNANATGGISSRCV